MLNKEWKWHYFMLHGMEYLVLGHNADRHDVLCVSLQHLHEKDKEDLMWIVDSDEAQKEAYLVAILARHPYAGGGTWWERLQPHVFFATIGQVAGRVPPEQLGVFYDAFSKTSSRKKDALDKPIPRCVLDTQPFPEVQQENSIPAQKKTENIDDILFGVVLSEEDRHEIADLKRRAGIL